MNILIIAGELSADYYGGQLAQSIQEDAPSSTLHALGGPQLQQFTHHFILNTIANHSVGLAEQWHHRSFFKLLSAQLTQYLAATSIQCAIIIDYPHYNFKIASILTKFNIPIVTFITPNFWVWNHVSHAKKLIKYSRLIITIYKKEHEFYQSLGANTLYLGHPIAQSMPRITPPQHRQTSSPPIITLMPGSRPSEIQRLLPKMCDIATYHHNRSIYSWNLLPPSPSLIPFRQSLLPENSPIRIWNKDKPLLMQKTVCVICGSGTTTLEMALHYIPQIVLAAASPLTYVLVKYILRFPIKYVSLPNIILNDAVVPEFIQHKITPANITHQLHHILHNPTVFQTMMQHYETIRNECYSPPVYFKKISRAILSVI